MRIPRLQSISFSPWLVGVFSMSLGAVLLWPRVMSGALRHWDEAWYAAVSREMLASGDWGTPMWNGAPFFHKPPLGFWAVAGTFYLFGESDIAARIFSLLCGVLLVGVLAWFVAKRTSAIVGFGAACWLLAIPEFCRYAARGQLDAPLALSICGQLVGFYLACDNLRWHWLGGLSLGFGLMAKGSAAFLAIFVVFAFALLVGEMRSLTNRGYWASILFGFALAVPWHAYESVIHGWSFWSDYLGRQIGRTLTPIDGDRMTAPWWYYLEFLADKQAPWGWIVLIAAVWGGIEYFRRVAAWRPVNETDRLLAFALAWTATIPIVLSGSLMKFSWYLVPMYPGAALLVALLIQQMTPKALVAVVLPMVAAMLTAGEGMWTPPNREHEAEIRELHPLVERYVPKEAAIIALQAGRARTAIYPIALVYYCRRQVHTHNSIGELVDAIHNTDCPQFIVAHRAHAAALRDNGLEYVELTKVGSVLLLQTDPSLMRLTAPTGEQRRAAR